MPHETSPAADRARELQNAGDHALIGRAAGLPAGAPVSVFSFAPVALDIPGRPVTLTLRVTAPATGTGLPILLLSHGQGRSNHLSSLNGYGPMAQFWASQGFVVLQPTHLSSKSLGLDPEGPGGPLFWRARVEDMSAILDRLDDVEAAVPGLAGRLDHGRIAVAGHSMGGHTAAMLLGATLVDPEDGRLVDLTDRRIRAGVLLAAPGNGGADLSTYAAQHYGFFSTVSFATMATPALVVASDDDVSPHLTVRGADWHADPWRLSPGPKSLFTMAGGGHCLGGISGYDTAETSDESPERVAVVQRMTLAWLKTQLGLADDAWQQAQAALAAIGGLGTVQEK
ncbi:alpha/beta hydrolase family protein [Rhizobium halophytocola]|uniref:Dienelactone hydrolase n=1 Tax=Rhizobium halophytocola TaxID=735519 RepID=A0ABS4E5R1_9HYPH|nr:chlorophyllase [Rhizobium halophytocola]MBP1853286.1 putative dienelactone hydrolase [Rhizobium halophytocola]